MAGLLDFIQGASNAAASNISAPVDGLAWLLKKAGVDVGTPVGGSDWMRQKGLTAEPENKFAGLLGESVGGLAPIIAAAKAPQIAKGLLQGAENMAAPRTLNPQTGAIVWHGSPHKFNQFDSAKIGTGEGAQAYGHGLYLAESPTVAKEYQKTLGDMQFHYNGKPLASGSIDDTAAQYIFGQQGNKEAALEDAFGNKALQNAIKKMDYSKVEKGGSLYKVDLPDEHIAKMLDWDKPLSQQPKGAQKALAKLDPDMYHPSGGDYDPTELGQMIYQRLAQNGQDAAASTMMKQGIPGIRYLDSGSRGAGTGSSNFVVFPGNESLLSILERNGQALK